MGPKKGKGILLAVTPDDEEDAEVEDEEMDDAPSEDQLDAAATLKEALDSGDSATIVDAFKAMKMACEEY